MPAERMTAGDKQWTASNTQFEGGMGIDATVPFGYESDFLRPVYPVDRVKPEEFFTKKDIENAKSRMQGWVHSLGRARGVSRRLRRPAQPVRLFQPVGDPGEALGFVLAAVGRVRHLLVT